MLETNKNAVTVLYSGGDIQVPFVFYDAADLVVLYDTTRKTLNTDYTVTGAGNASGGKVKLTNAPANGTRVTVLRLIDFVQLLEIPSNGILPEGALNRALDRIVMMIQQLAERADRAVTYPAGTDKGIVLNIVEILRDVNAATGDARGSATAAAASADEAKEFARLAGVAHQSTLTEKVRVRDEGDKQVLRVSTEGLNLLHMAEQTIRNTDVDQIAQPEWESPVQNAVIHGGTLKCKAARLAYAPQDSLKHSSFWMTSDEAGENVVYPVHSEAGLSHELKIHLMKPNTTYYAFSNQTTDKGAVSRKTVPLKLTTADVLQFVAPPETLEPLEGQAYSGATMRMRLKPIVVDPSQPAQHTKTEYRVKFGDTEIIHKTITTNLLDEKLPFLERLKDFVLEVRVYDEVRGWSGWTTVNFKTNEEGSYLANMSLSGKRDYLVNTAVEADTLIVSFRAGVDSTHERVSLVSLNAGTGRVKSSIRLGVDRDLYMHKISFVFVEGDYAYIHGSYAVFNDGKGYRCYWIKFKISTQEIMWKRELIGASSNIRYEDQLQQMKGGYLVSPVTSSARNKFSIVLSKNTGDFIQQCNMWRSGYAQCVSNNYAFGIAHSAIDVCNLSSRVAEHKEASGIYAHSRCGVLVADSKIYVLCTANPSSGGAALAVFSSRGTSMIANYIYPNFIGSNVGTPVQLIEQDGFLYLLWGKGIAKVTKLGKLEWARLLNTYITANFSSIHIVDGSCYLGIRKEGSDAVLKFRVDAPPLGVIPGFPEFSFSEITSSKVNGSTKMTQPYGSSAGFEHPLTWGDVPIVVESETANSTVKYF